MVTKRVKAPVRPIIHSRDEANTTIARIGYLQREIERIKLIADEKQQAIIDEATLLSHDMIAELQYLTQDIALYGEVNRNKLTHEGKVKTAKFDAGEIRWRFTPMGVSLTNVKEILSRLKQLGLERFIRIKEEPDKEAMLKEPDVAKAIEGISITQREEIIIVPKDTGIEIAHKVAARRTTAS